MLQLITPFGVGLREQPRLGHGLTDGLELRLTAMELMSHLLREELATDGEVAPTVKLSGLLREAIGQTQTLARAAANPVPQPRTARPRRPLTAEVSFQKS
jgi:hypothetical protein